MLSRQRRAIAEQVGFAVAHNLFVAMLNPRFRGKEFTWDKLSVTAARHARAAVGMACPNENGWGRDEKRMEEAAAGVAVMACRRILEDSGVEEWLKL